MQPKNLPQSILIKSIILMFILTLTGQVATLQAAGEDAPQFAPDLGTDQEAGLAQTPDDLVRFGEITFWVRNYGDAVGWKNSPAYWQTIRFPDVNGDKKADVCGRGGDGLMCGVSNGREFLGISRWSDFFTDADGWQADPAYYRTLQFPHVQGFARSDVCGRGSNGIFCGLSFSRGSTFIAERYWDSSFSDAAGWKNDESYWGTIQFPDVNGDGMADVCGRGNSGIVCGVSDFTRFKDQKFWENHFGDTAIWKTHESYWGTIQFPDLNGDGQADVCGRNSTGLLCELSNGSSFFALKFWSAQFDDGDGWKTHQSYWGTIQFPDLNGDGKADVCGRDSRGLVCGLNSGNSFESPTVWHAEFSDTNGWKAHESYWGTIQFPDLNGDGQADVCGRRAQGLFCALSTGTKFDPTPIEHAGFADGVGWKTHESYWGTIQFPDLNGDGKADVCGRDRDGILCAPTLQKVQPEATTDSYQITQDLTLVVEAEEGVLSNDSDGDGDEMRSHLISDVNNGSLSLNLDGSFSYTPNPGFTGADQFRYAARDTDFMTSNVAAVTIQVKPAPTPEPTSSPIPNPSPSPTSTPDPDPTPVLNPGNDITVFLPLVLR